MPRIIISALATFSVLCSASATGRSLTSSSFSIPVLNYEYAFTAKIYTDQTQLAPIPIADGGMQISAFRSYHVIHQDRDELIYITS